MLSQDYEDIKELVSNIYEDYEINNVPVDIFGLINQMSFKLVYASNLLKNKLNKG